MFYNDGLLKCEICIKYSKTLSASLQCNVMWHHGLARRHSDVDTGTVLLVIYSKRELTQLLWILSTTKQLILPTHHINVLYNQKL